MSAPLNRPLIPSATVTKHTSEEERFQNNVLRPIIKAQHDLLMMVFVDYVLSKNIDIKNINKDNRKLKIKSIFTTDTHFKNELKGIVIGQFSPEEYQQYTRIKAKINKRIWSIQCQRVLDSMPEIFEKLQ